VSVTRALKGVLFGLAAGVATVGAAYHPLVEAWENLTLDRRMRWFAAPERADSQIVAIVIDERSLQRIAAPRELGGLELSWPWPRDIYAPVVDYVIEAGARAIAFDMMFSEPSPLAKDYDDDRTFAAATAGRPVLEAAMFTRERVGGETVTADQAWPTGFPYDRRIRRLTESPREQFNKAILPIDPLRAAAGALGSIRFEPDDDGTCRSVAPAAAYSPAPSPDVVEVWSLPFALAALVGVRVEAAAGRPAAEGLLVNGRPLPLDEKGRLLLRFHGREDDERNRHTYRQFSFVKVLESARLAKAKQPVEHARPDEFRGKIVLVGANASSLFDLRTTPMNDITPGYVIHATALDNLLHGDALVRPAWRTRALIVIVLGAVVGFLLGGLPSFRDSTVAAFGLALSCIAVALWSFVNGRWIDMLAPTLSIAFTYGLITGYGYVTEGRERRFLRSAFARYVAPEMVEQLVRHPDQLALGGETREMTVMFADVAGFTSLSEGRPPKEIVELMNECFTELTTVIQGHGGTVDKFIGDAVMAFWNAPVEQPDHAARACRATADLLAGLQRLNAGWSQRGLPRISMRVGLATGPALVGNVGSTSKFNYTVMGDTVNLASRLEGAAKVYGTLSLIAGSTVAAAEGAVPLRELDWLQVKGRSEPVPVFEVLPANPSPTQAEVYDRYAKGLAAYRGRRFDEAHDQFAAALRIDPDDGPSKEMLTQCDDYLVNPPPAGWRGEHVLHTK